MGRALSLLSLSLSVYFNGNFSRWIHRYQNVSILDFIGTKDDGGGGDSWSYKTCKAQSDATTNKPTLGRLQADALPVARSVWAPRL